MLDCYQCHTNVEVLRVPLQVFIFSEFFLFFHPSCLLYGKDFFRLSARLKEARGTAFDNENMKFSEKIHKIKTYKTYRDA